MSLFQKHPKAKASAPAAAPAPMDSVADFQADVQAVMEKYDRESNTRSYSGLPARAVSAILIAFSFYILYMNLLSTWDTHIRKASFVGLIILLTFILYPAKKGMKRRVNYIPWYDVLLGLAGFASFFYYVLNYKSIIQRSTRITQLEVIIGVIGILVLFEACRRVTGIPILCVAAGFIAYAFFAGLNLKQVVYTLFYTDTGILGTPTSVCSTYIVIFILFGAFLEISGIADFFIQIANSIAGRSCGGPAKVAVIASALEGMASGSSVANTVGSGSITIPMMKRLGYKPEFAGAVEAAASTGGQIMPPIMGAAAFLMAEFIGVPYSTVAVQAILPAFLYFTGIFLMVHLEAKKLGLRGIPKEELPVFHKLFFSKGYLLLPLIILVTLVMSGSTMQMAAFVGIVATMVVSFFHHDENAVTVIVRIVSMAVVAAAAYFVTPLVVGRANLVLIITILAVAAFILLVSTKEKNQRMNLSIALQALENGARNTLSVAVACAVAGIIAGVVTKTGLGNLLISAIVSFSGGVKIFALFLTMIACIILGMGVPTTANFVIMAITCAPILIKGMGIEPTAAYMFVFYFGIVADITPPVALAAYAGAAIAKSNPMQTGLTASRLAIAAFIVPYIFALNPAMLFINTTPVDVILICVTSVIGMFGVSAGLEGFMLRHLAGWQRVLCVICGLMLIYPGLVTDLIGFGGIAAVFLLQKVEERKAVVHHRAEEVIKSEAL